MPNTVRNDPQNTIGRIQPMSNNGPAKTPMKTTRNACTLPIHEMADVDSVERRSRI